MTILILGGGGREHALAATLAREPGLRLVCAPGNPGMADLAELHPADIGDPEALLAVARHTGADLTLVGPELPLSRGVVDLFAADRRAIVGPTRAAAALESSKAFAKAFMARHGVPTARARLCESAAEARAALAEGTFGVPVVLKADGLAAGKGVVIAADAAAAEAAVHDMMEARRFGDAGDRLVIEECLAGEEASFFVLTDGTHAMAFGSAQDHKRIFDGDRGPNTGGMGAFAPSPLVTPALQDRILREIVRPVLDGMRAEGVPYRGFLYVGLMLTAAGPRVIEFNVRFGDPEAQVLLPMLGEPLSPLLAAAAEGTLPDRPAIFRPEPHVAVVLAAGGYPDTPETGRVIAGLDEAAAVSGAMIFHAGTARRDDALVTAGGRVLNVVGRGASHREAIDTAYRAAACIRFEGLQYRRDIGARALGAAAPLS
jgi:phosphoribosylamine---glycine ligase